MQSTLLVTPGRFDDPKAEAAALDLWRASADGARQDGPALTWIRTAAGWLVSGEPSEVKRLRGAAEERNLHTRTYEDTHRTTIGGWELTADGDGGVTARFPDRPDLEAVAGEFDEHEPGHPAEWIVQLVAPPTPELLASALEDGTHVVGLLPPYAVHVRTASRAAPELAPGVRWVRRFLPLYRVHQDVLGVYAGGGRHALLRYASIRVDPPAAEEAIRQRLRALGASIVDPGERRWLREASGRIVCSLPLRALPALMADPRVRFLAFVPDRPALEGEIDSLGVAARPLPSEGYRKWLDQVHLSGDGTRLAICDTGVDQNRATNRFGSPDLRGRMEDWVDYTGGEVQSDTSGHGTVVATVAVGAGIVNAFEGAAVEGRRAGLGVAPAARWLALNAIAEPKEGWGATAPWWPAPDLGRFAADAALQSADVMVMSWTTDPTNPMKGYTDYTVGVDRMVRDPSGGHLGQDELVVVFSAGNQDGGAVPSLTEPKESKNAIVVGATNSPRRGDGTTLHPPDTVLATSARGPTTDGRIVPHVVAPGKDVVGVRAAGNEPDTGTKLVSENVGVKGVTLSTSLPQSGNLAVVMTRMVTEGTEYVRATGTSFSAALVSGEALLVIEWWRSVYAGDPTPAMVKALIVNGAVDLSAPPPQKLVAQGPGSGPKGEQQAAGGGVPSPSSDPAPGTDEATGLPLAPIPNGVQGWGAANLANVILQEGPFDARAGRGGARPITSVRAHGRGPRLVWDRQELTPSAPLWETRVCVARPGQPLRVTLAWTDAPGSPGCKALVNDLDLEVEAENDGARRVVYRGNVFKDGWSVPGGSADAVDNLECVYLREATGVYTLRVRATSLSADARPPYSLAAPWQDFALTADNARAVPDASRAVAGVLDVSASMVQTLGEPEGAVALQELFLPMRPTETVGVASFAQQPSEAHATRLVAPTQLRRLAHAPPLPPGDRRSTSLHAAIDAAIATVAKVARPGARTAAIVLTDGLESGKPTPGTDLTAAALGRGSEVHFLALWPTADLARLSALATTAKGRLHYAPTPGFLGRAAAHARSDALDEQLVVCERLDVTRGAERSTVLGAWIEAEATRAVVTVTFPSDLQYAPGEVGAMDAVAVLLHDPRGRQLPANTTVFGRESGPGWVRFEVERPRAGQWAVELRAYGVPDSSGPVPMTVAVSVASPVKVTATIAYPVSGDKHRLGVTVEVKSPFAPLPELRVEANVERPFADTALNSKHRGALEDAPLPDASLDGLSAKAQRWHAVRSALANAEPGYDLFEPLTHRMDPFVRAGEGLYGAEYGCVDLPGAYTAVLRVWAWDHAGATRLQRACRVTTYAALDGKQTSARPCVIEPEHHEARVAGTVALIEPGEEILGDECGYMGAVAKLNSGATVTGFVDHGATIAALTRTSPGNPPTTVTVGHFLVLADGTLGDGLAFVGDDGVQRSHQDIARLNDFAIGRDHWVFNAAVGNTWPTEAFTMTVLASFPAGLTPPGGVYPTYVAKAFDPNTTATSVIAGSTANYRLARPTIGSQTIGYLTVSPGSGGGKPTQTWYVDASTGALHTGNSGQTGLTVDASNPLKFFPVGATPGQAIAGTTGITWVKLTITAP